MSKHMVNYRGEEHGEGLGQRLELDRCIGVVRIPEARTLTCGSRGAGGWGWGGGARCCLGGPLSLGGGADEVGTRVICTVGGIRSQAWLTVSFAIAVGHAVLAINGVDVNGKYTADGKEVLEYLGNPANYPVSIRFGRPRLTSNEKLMLASMFHS